jgi:hypothetical protein
MKVINVTLEDSEHKIATERKGQKTWKEIIMQNPKTEDDGDEEE